MRIDILRPDEIAGADAVAWEALRGQGPQANPFFSLTWAKTLSSVGGPDQAGAQVAVIREGEAAVGFYPVRKRRLTAMPMGAPLCDYQGLIAGPGLKLEPRDLLRAFGVQRLDFSHLLSDQTPFAPYMKGTAVSQIIDLRQGHDAYARGRQTAGTDILKDSAKKRRKLEREHGEAVFTARSASRADLGQLLAWKRAQYAKTRQTDIFDAGWPLAVLERLFASDDADCRGLLFTLHVGGALVAAHFAMASRTVLHAWFIAHDDAFGRYSPGCLLIVDIIRWAADAGYHEIDLGPGDYRFKCSLANRTQEVSHGYVGRPASPAALIRAAQYGVRHTAEALPLGNASSLPGKAMRRLDLWRGMGIG